MFTTVKTQKELNLLQGSVSTLVIRALTNLNMIFKIHLILCALVVYMKNQHHICFSTALY